MLESKFGILALGLVLGGCTLTSGGTGATSKDAEPGDALGDSGLVNAPDDAGLDGSSEPPEGADAAAVDGGDSAAPEVDAAALADASSFDGSEPEAAAMEAGGGALDGAPSGPDGGDDASTPEASVDGSMLDAGAGDDAAMQDASPDAQPGVCGLDGRYALRVDTRVEWEAKRLFGFVPIIRAGEGDLSVTVLVDFETVGTDVTGTVLPCDAAVPDFESSNIGGNEDYATYFAPAVWDSPTMPRATAHGTLGCTIPGCVLDVHPLEVLLGTQTAQPFAPWPEDREELAYPDDDSDGSPGLTISVRGPEDSTGEYSYIPVGTSGTRTSEIHLGIRVAVDLSGALDDCGDSLSGAAGTFAIDTHVAGCTTTNRRNAPCSDNETQFLDDNLPQWTSNSLTFRGVRVDPQAGCYEAREAFTQP